VVNTINLEKGEDEYSKQDRMWDRDLWDKRHEYKKVERFNEVFVGHTSIYRFSHFPFKHGNVWFMDTGGGWEGCVSIMDIDTKEFWQSDLCSHLYPEEGGRN